MHKGRCGSHTIVQHWAHHAPRGRGLTPPRLCPQEPMHTGAKHTGAHARTCTPTHVHTHASTSTRACSVHRAAAYNKRAHGPQLTLAPMSHTNTHRISCMQQACMHARTHTHTHTHTHTPGGSLLSLLLGCYLLLALLNVARLVVGRQAGSFLQAQEQRTPRARSPWVPHSAGALSEFPADFYVAEQQTTGKHTHMRTHTQNQHANPPNTSTGISAYA